jgi:uncharacterized membrane protein SpoIIM required for sporulation
LRWRDAVAAAGREAGLLVLGTVPLFFIAAVIESVIRQTALPDSARYVMAAVSFAAWFLYFTLTGRSAESRTTARKIPPM